MGAFFTLFIVSLTIALVLLIGYFSIYNGIKTSELKVSEALSGIDVALTKRYDVLTKMLNIAKNYMSYESTTLRDIVSLRAGMSVADRSAANKAMDQAARELNIVAEQYPQLRSSANFVELQKAVIDVEEHLQAARRLYNSNVTDYNRRLVTFPSSVVAGMMGATQKSFFEAEDVKRQDVKMTF